MAREFALFEDKNKGSLSLLRVLLALAFWLLIWQALAMRINQAVLIATPAATFARIAELVVSAEFWLALATSLIRIFSGLILAALIALLLAALSTCFRLIDTLIAPLAAIIKAAPVASFVVLLLIWAPSRYLSTTISFLMAFSIFYANIREGLSSLDVRMAELGKVYKMPFFARMKLIYLSQLLPYVHASLSLALGLCWKAGVAAELIALPAHTIGTHLYDAKIYLDTASLFAWTAMLILISVVGEKLIDKLLSWVVQHFEEAN